MLATLLLSIACTPDTPPNVVVILVDDLGYGDLGGALPGIGGRADHRTPNIVALAREGLVLTNGYAAAPNCAPSRASLQTGRVTPRHGVLTVGSSSRGKAKDRELVPVKNNTVLADDEVTLAERLALAGYMSAHVGKWHLGDDARTQGYAFNVGGNRAGHPKSYFAPYRNPQLADGPDGEYLTTRLTDEAIDLLDEMEGPFFLHLAYYTVHTPLQAPAERVAEREAAGARSPRFAAMVEALDHEVGRVLRALDEKGLTENTVVVFTSDNGGHSPVTNREILRGYKGTLDEGGVRVPWIVRWPGRIAPGVSDAVVHHVDLFPTLSRMAGITEPAANELDGVDVSPLLLERASVAARDLHWHFPCYLEGESDRFPKFRTTPGGSMRAGDWKLMEYFHADSTEAPRLELYDLNEDPLETRDVIAEERERAQSMYARLQAWRSRTGATVPTTAEPRYEPPAAPVDLGPGFREVVADPSLWAQIELDFAGDERLIREAAEWSPERRVAALHRYLFGQLDFRERRVLERALAVGRERTIDALIALMLAPEFRADWLREETFERGVELFGDAPSPRVVRVVAPYLESESDDVRRLAAYTIGKVGSAGSIAALETVAGQPSSRVFQWALLGLAFPASEGRVEDAARAPLFAMLRDAIPAMEEDVDDAIEMMLQVDRERAIRIFVSDELLRADAPHVADVVQALVAERVEVPRERVLALLVGLDELERAYPLTRALGDTLTLLGRVRDAADRARLERGMDDTDAYIANGAAAGLAAWHGMEDGLARIFDLAIDGDIGALPAEGRRMWAVWMLDAEVNNGGFDQYYFNSSGNDWEFAVAGLDALGMTERAAILRVANARFGAVGPPVRRSARMERLAALSTDEESAFEAEDTRWYACAELVEPALVRYMIEHRKALGL